MGSHMTKPGKVNSPPLATLTSATGLGGTAKIPTLGELTDVDLTGISDGDIIYWDDASQTWLPTAPGGAGSIDIDDLTDVDTTSTPPSVGDTLVWDGTNWVPQAPEDLDLSDAGVMWRPVMTTSPDIVTTDGAAVYTVWVTAEGEAIMVYS